MSTTIDQRVVEMRFDNKQFEANVATTMSTLEKLKSKLNFTESAKGLEAIGKAANKTDFSGLNAGVETVHAKFSALEVIGMSALNNITNSAMNAGKQMLKSLTIEPVKTGFNEYELKMGSLQTIMASTGESIQTVNKYLNELNEYSDKTIYSFSDMTQNIGKFTNAGVKLEDAVKAIQGVSNVAAISGANANEASRAMYNFAQALSAGSVKLIDWRSIENANMGTKAFKEELIATAVEMGTLIKVGEEYKSATGDLNGKVSDLFTSTKGFTESLSHQWMTTDVLVKTLNRYADASTDIGGKAFAAAQDVKTFTQLLDTLKESAQSGWATTWEHIFGNLEEAKVLWTDVNNAISPIISAMSDTRNEMLGVWKTFGGRDSMISTVANAFNALKNIVISVGEAFREVFPKMSGKELALLTKRIEKVMLGFRQLTERNMTKTKKVFEAFFSIVKAITTVLGGAFAIALKVAVVAVSLLAQVTFDVAEKIADVILGIKKWATQNQALSKVVKTTTAIIAAFVKGVVNLATSIASGIVTSITIVKTLIQEFMNLPIVQTILNGIATTVQNVAALIVYFFGGIVEAVRGLFHNLANLKNISFETVTAVFVDFGTKVKDIFSDVSKLFTDIVDAVKSFGDAVDDSFETTGKTVEGLQGKFVTFTTIVRNCLYSIGPAEVFAVGFGVALIYFLRKFTLAVNKIIKPVNAFSGVLTNFGAVLNSVAWSVKASALTSAALAITMMAASLIALAKMCTPEELATPFAMILALGAALTAFAKVAGSFGNVDKFVFSIIAMASSVLILTGAMKVIESIDETKIKSVFETLAYVMITAAALAIGVSRAAPVLAANSPFMLAFSGAILLLSLSMERIASIDENTVSRGIANMMLIAAGLAAVSIAVSGLKMGSAASILLIAGGVYALLTVVELIGMFTSDDAWNTIKILAGVTLAVIPLFAATKLAGQYALGAGAALIGMAAAFVAMQNVFKTLESIDPDQLTYISGNLFMLMAGMAGLVAATKFARKAALQAGTMLLQMAGAMIILTAAITVLSHVDAWGLVKATAVISGIMFMMKLLIEATGYARDCKATLIIMAGVIALMVASIGVLAMLPAEDLALATASILGILGVFTLLIKALGTINNVTADVGMLKNIALGIGLLGGIFTIIGVFLGALQYFNVQPSFETVASISVLLLAIAGVCAILCHVAPLATAASASLGPISAMLVYTAAALGLIGGIAALIGYVVPKDAEAKIQRGLDIIKMICWGIGEALGSVIGGFASGTFSGLLQIGKTLSTFITDVSGFVEGVGNVSERAVDGTERLCSILLKLGGTTFLQNLGGFYDAFGAIANSNIEGSLGAVDAIASLGSAAPKMQKLVDWFEGNDLTAFNRNMVLFGNTMTSFAGKVSEFPADTIMSVNAISQSMNTLQNGIKGNAVFTGEIDLDKRGQELAKFGTHLYNFYNKVSGINAGQLGSVMTGLDTLTTAVRNIGTVDESTMSTFRTTFTNMGNQAITAFVETFRNATPQVSQAVNGLLSTISAAMSGNVPVVKAMGQTMISNMILGMQEMQTKVVETTANITRAGYFETTKFYTSFYQSGEYLVQGLINGMKSKRATLKSTSEDLGDLVVTNTSDAMGVHSPSVFGFDIGAFFDEGVIQGLMSKFGELKTTVTEGMQENVLDPMGDVQTKAKEAGSGIMSGWTNMLMDSIVNPAMDYIPELKTMFGEVSVTASEIALGDGVTETVEDLSSALDSAGVSSGNLNKALGGTSAGASSLSKALSKTTKKKQIDINKTYEATTALERYMERLYKESDQYKTDTEILKNYRTELAELQNDRDEMQKQLKENTEGRIKLSKEEKEQVEADLKELEDTIYSKQEDIATHLETMCDNAKAQYDGLRDAIKTSIKDAFDISNIDIDTGIDWFSAFELDEETTADSVLENMKSQYEGVKQWQKNLEKLSKRKGMSEGLLNELREMGISGASYVQAFVEMSNSELKKAAKYFNESGSLMGQKLMEGMKSAFVNVETWKESLSTLLTTGLDQRLVEQLAEMGTSSQEYIDAFLSLDEKDIEEFNKMYAESLTLPDAAANDMMVSFVNAGNNAATAFIDAVNTVVGTDGETQTVLVEEAHALGENVTTAIEEGVKEAQPDTVKTATTAGDQILDGFKDYLNYEEGKEIGENVTEGIERGIKSGKSGVIKAAIEVAAAAIKAAKDELDINSPSGVFEALGQFSDLGMVKGLLGFAGKVKMAAANVGGEAYDGMKNSLRSIGAVVDGNFDYEPVITPIVDLTNVEESAARIAGLFTNSRSMTLAVNGQRGINASLNARHTAEVVQPTKGDTTIKFEQNNYSPKALSRIDIYRQTKNQFSMAKEVLNSK